MSLIHFLEVGLFERAVFLRGYGINFCFLTVSIFLDTMYSSKSHKKFLVSKSHRNKKLCLWLLLNKIYVNSFLDEYNNAMVKNFQKLHFSILI